MGHLVNPISARLGIVRVWNSTWVSNKGLFYSYLLAKDLELQKSLEIFFYKTNSTDFWSIIFDKALIFRTSKRIYVFIVLYSWRFFGMLERLLKMLGQGQHVFDFKELFSDDQHDSYISSTNLRGLKNVVSIYSRVVVDSFNKFKEKTVISIQQQLILLLFSRCLNNYLSIRDRYLFFFKVLKDYLVLRIIYINSYTMFNKFLLKNRKFTIVFFSLLIFVYTKISKYKIFLSKNLSNFSFKIIKQYLYVYMRKNFFSQHNGFSFKRVFILKNYIRSFFFLRKYSRFILNNIVFGNLFNPFRFSLYSKKFRSLLACMKQKKGITFAFKLPVFISLRSSFFVSYIKNLISIYNYKINLFLSLLKHSYTWWIFVLIKIFLRKHIVAFYGKRLWYIKSFITYFFGYKNKQPSNLFIYFLFPSFLILTARMLSYVIRIRLTQKYSLGEILNKFVSYLDKQSSLIGYRITCHGRFTRRQRASHKMVKSSLKYKDRLLLNTFTGVVDYAYVEEPLKYGMCGIRIWLVKQDLDHYREKHCFSLRKVFFNTKYKHEVLILKKIIKLRSYLSDLNIYKKYSTIEDKKSFFFKQKQLFKLKKFIKNFHFKYYILFKKLFGIPFSFRNKYQSELFIEEFKKKFYLLY